MDRRQGGRKSPLFSTPGPASAEQRAKGRIAVLKTRKNCDIVDKIENQRLLVFDRRAKGAPPRKARIRLPEGRTNLRLFVENAAEKDPRSFSGFSGGQPAKSRYAQDLFGDF